MLCIDLYPYSRSCDLVTGGVSDIWVFDPEDFDFTQSGNTGVTAYSVVARRTGATSAGGALMYRMRFSPNEAQRTFNRTMQGCSVQYEHIVTCPMPQLSLQLGNLIRSFDRASCCCGIGLVVRHNDSKIFIGGESYVNGTRIPNFQMKLMDTTGDSGKAFSDFNGANMQFKGMYSRPMIEFSGGMSAITAMES